MAEMSEQQREAMRILVAYDGSESGDAMLRDLQWAGLPGGTEVEVVTVLETWFPLPASIGGVETGYAREELTGVETARWTAREGCESLRRLFPDWKVDYAAASGTPASVVLQRAEAVKSELIVAAAHGHSAFHHLFLGNVAQKLAMEAHCSVRVARGRKRGPGEPLRLIIGVDGSAQSEAAVGMVAERAWPKGSEVRVVNAVWNLPAPASGVERHENMKMQIAEWVAAENARIATIIEQSVKRLQAAGLAATAVVREEDPKRLLVREAGEWKADCVFVGARGLSRLERVWLGSVSSAVVMRAPCTVEIVRNQSVCEIETSRIGG